MKIKKEHQRGFTIVDNLVLNDANLSWKAKGLFTYLWSQTDEWDFYETEVVKHSTDGLSSLRSGIKELEKQEYLRRERKRDDKGYFRENDWILSENPTCENRILDNRTLTSTNNNNTNNNKTLFTQDSINTKGIGILAESDGDNKNKGRTKNKENNKKDNDKESNRVKDKDSVNTNKDLKGNIDNECSIDKKESKGRGSSVNTKIDNTCNIENEKKHSHGIDNKCSKENKDNFDYKRFIEWFNKETGKRFRNTESNRKLVRARLNEGYIKEDIAKVVKLKAEQWKDDKQMNKYLRFTTLFAPTHFDNYLQEWIETKGETLEPQKKKRESSAEEKINQYKFFLREHPDNETIRKALEQLEQSKE